MTTGDITKRYDYFIAVPMSSLAPAEYVEFRLMLRDLCDCFDRDGHHVFCAPFKGEEANFNDSAVAYKMDTDALWQSDCCVVILPRAVYTGAIFEAGYADAIGMPCIWFVKDRKDMPYMLREADKAAPGRIAIVEYTETSDIPALLATIRPTLMGGAKQLARA